MSRISPKARRLSIGADRGRAVSEPVHALSYEETAAGSSLPWHTAPVRQYVITLTGTLEFETRGGERFTLSSGDVLLAEDTTGGGHRWRLIDDQPWTRVYVTLASEQPGRAPR